jgi:hypothetical protein
VEEDDTRECQGETADAKGGCVPLEIEVDHAGGEEGGPDGAEGDPEDADCVEPRDGLGVGRDAEFGANMGVVISREGMEMAWEEHGGDLGDVTGVASRSVVARIEGGQDTSERSVLRKG